MAKTATFTIGTTQSGHTSSDVDYLCTGTNDQNVFTNAVNALPSVGGKIVVLEGNYYFSNYVYFGTKQLTISGMGYATKIIRRYNENSTTPHGLFHFPTKQNDHRVIIEKFYFDGQRATYTSVDNVAIRSKANCITVRDCYFANNDTGVYMQDNLSSVIADNWAVNNNTGFFLIGTGNCKIYGNQVNTATYGIFLADMSQGNNIFGNNSYHCDYGIRVQDSSYNTLIGNQCIANPNRSSITFNGTDSVNRKNIAVGNSIYGVAIYDAGTSNHMANNY